MKRAFYAFLINWYQASDKALPDWLERACQRDSALARERDSGDVLTESLREKRVANEEPEYASMRNQVMSRIAEEDAEESFSKGEINWGGLLKGAGYLAAAAFVVLFVVSRFSDTNVSSQQVAGKDGVPEESTKIELAIVPVESLEEVGVEIMQMPNPLNQEIKYVISDAKGALDFLKTSFVPSTYLESNSKRG